MRKPKEGYKIVSRNSHSGKFFSLILRRSAWVQYKINKFVKYRNGCGPLAVFENLEDAKHFGDSYPQSPIFKCHYFSSRREFLRLAPRAPKSTCFPRGTMFATRVKLLEKIEEE